MLLKLFIISLILMAFIMLALGVKLLFDPNAEFSSHSCSIEDRDNDEYGACAKCQLKDLTDCPENRTGV